MADLASLERRIAQLERLLSAALDENVRLQARVEELEARLNDNSRNSHQPPSADPPWSPPPSKPPTGRKPGGQPGHKRHKREMLPAAKVDHLVDLHPDHCSHCDAGLAGTAGRPDRHQVTELPELRAHVTEYRLHRRRCGDCGRITRAALPSAAQGAFGPRLRALIALCTARHHMSKRSVQEFLADVMGVSISLGAVSDAEAAVSEAVAPAVDKAIEHVRHHDGAVHADETGWAIRGDLAWLWTATTQLVTVFQVDPRRNEGVARQLLGDDFGGVLGSDRWSAYDWVPLDRRQICWAHLIRDFQKMIDHAGRDTTAVWVGVNLLALSRKLFRWWGQLGDARLDRMVFDRRLAALQGSVRNVLRTGAQAESRKVAGMCRHILAREAALWTFTLRPGVEPTNNLAERALRPAVLWRKGSFGTQGERGNRFVARLLSVTATLRAQGRSVFAFLSRSLQAASARRATPSLLPAA